jgi:hypothetical protein
MLSLSKHFLLKKCDKENKIPFLSFCKKLPNKHPPTKERCLRHDKKTTKTIKKPSKKPKNA